MAVKGVESVRRALQVLEEVATSQPVGVSALARSLHITKSTAQRLLVSLAEAGWISANGSDPVRWVIAPHALTIAQAAARRDGFVSQLAPAMAAIRDACGETTFVAVPERSRMVMVEVLPSTNSVCVVIRPGTVSPASVSAGGLAIAAFLDDDARRELLGGLKPAAALADELTVVEKRGFAVLFGAVRNDIRTVAAPVFDARGLPVAAVGIAAPADRLDLDRAEQIGRSVISAVASCGLGSMASQ